MLDLEAVRGAIASHAPFPHFVAHDLLRREALHSIARDFPAISAPGLFPLNGLEHGPAFGHLIEGIRSPELADLVGAKLGLELADLPLLVTVRGHCHRKDGRIHTDSTDKVATCLLYLNEDWHEPGGRLRLLRSATDIEDVLVEIPPDGGTLVGFRRTDNSWHGHLPFAGPRRYVMFNWVSSEAALSRNVARHRLSARLKRFNPFR